MKDNLLIHETSLYLLKHAKNPVSWVPWSSRAFELAIEENKMVLVSIGYSSCHWCHVMEHECFENEQIAEYMNDNFICIKVDREERPDIDHLYMKAIQLMGANGGWPLNCFVLPDGRPIYGGTYFNQNQWLHILRALVETFANEKEKVSAFADTLEKELKSQEGFNSRTSIPTYSKLWISNVMKNWESSFDSIDGGFNYVPKFPMPNNLLSILHYALFMKNSSIMAHFNKTLLKMSYGGLYDQVKGGFSRYSTDAIWKVPHFEKMLYDNAQLIELYSEGYNATQNKEYKEVVYKSFHWLNSELKTEYGSYLCSQDADSEGVEGAFYCWEEEELRSLLKSDFDWFQDYYNISYGKIWEEERYILYRDKSFAEFAESKGWSNAEFQPKLDRALHILSETRALRKPPSIDTKSLSSWNALLIKGLCKAYVFFEDEVFLESAKEIASWINKYQINPDSSIHHNFVKGKTSIDGFLEDYAFVIEAFILLYQVSRDIEFLETAKNLAEKVESDFNSIEHGLYYFSNSNSKLITRKIDVEDDVMPSSNSVMAHCYYQLGVYYRLDDWITKSHNMLSIVLKNIEKSPMGYSNWFLLYLKLSQSNTEITILNDDSVSVGALKHLIHPFKTISYHETIPMSNGFLEGIYVCKDKTCLPKINSVEDLLIKLNRND